jgi:hypothetical protein
VAHWELGPVFYSTQLKHLEYIEQYGIVVKSRLKELLDLLLAPIPKRLCMTIASLSFTFGRINQIATDRIQPTPWNNWVKKHRMSAICDVPRSRRYSLQAPESFVVNEGDKAANSST